MQIANLIVSSLALVVSAATLTVLLVGGARIQQEMDAFKASAELKRAELKAAFEKLI